MAKNFVILFHAREGSTAIVDALSRHPMISVPILEELDRFWIKKFYQDRNLNLPAVMHKLFSENRFELGDDWGFKNFISEDKRGRDMPSVGFKWRPHGPLNAIARTFVENDVAVFLLTRRELPELAASLAISAKAAQEKDTVGAGHAQFVFSQMSPDEQASYRAKLERTTYQIKPFALQHIMARRCYHAFRLRNVAQRFARHGVPVHSLYYEDFAQNPDQFFAGLCAEIGVDRVDAQSLTEGQIVKKASRVKATDRIADFNQIMSRPLCRSMDRFYRTTTRAIEHGDAQTRGVRGLSQAPASPD